MDAYERGRPGYPSVAIEWLAHRVSLGRGVTVVDLAAGTGKLTRPLAATGARVVAIEPLAAMRQVEHAPDGGLDSPQDRGADQAVL
ncbi:MAG: hypothetical protein LC790_10630 [Actinobacteria bacterium]|nr:hypothetical protein [Actinomycetota bacterium]